MRRMASEILVQTKDGLRGLRYVIRHEARAPSLPILPDALRRAGLPGNPIARLADEMLSQAESVARVFDPARLLPADLAPPILVRGAAGVFPQPAAAYLADGGRHRFVAGFYRGLKVILAGAGADNVLVSESAVEAAHEGLVRRHGDLLRQAAGLGGAEASPAVAAAIAVELLRAGPVVRADGLDGLPARCDTNRFCALVAGLATAVASLAGGEVEAGTTIIASAADTVAVRFDRLAAALDADEPAAALADVYRSLAPYLP